MVYAGGLVTDPSHTLFIWRTAAFSKARGCVVGFYRWDSFFEALWRSPQRYIDLFLQHEVTAVVEPDFSLWRDDPLIVHVYNVYRTRWMGRYWQEAGITVIPSLNWSDERSFSFAFSGIPQHAPVVAVECRTAGQTDGDRRAFLAGLSEGVRQVAPQKLIIYGGREHVFWLSSRLPEGPHYTLLESWTHCRDRTRTAERRQARARNQLRLFPTGGEQRWEAEAVAEAARVAAHE
jgi:hypothetical protein